MGTQKDTEKKIVLMKRKRKLYFTGALIFAIGALITPILLTQFDICVIHLGEPKDVGSIIGGITSPFLTLLAIWLTFEAFWVQYESNQHQIEISQNQEEISLKQEAEAAKQRMDIKKERFENKFFRFLDLLHNQEAGIHMTNVGDAKQVFHFMFYEFKAIYYLVHISNVYKGCHDRKKYELEQSYYLFLNGVSKSSISRLSETCSDKLQKKIKELNNVLLLLQESFLINGGKPKYLKDYGNANIKLFDGHRLRLISYYRTVCTIVQYVYQNIQNQSIKEEEKNVYRNILLSQLSEHEIALLKIIYKFDKLQNVKFILSEYEQLVDCFFSKTLSQYIVSETMNCDSDRFIDV